MQASASRIITVPPFGPKTKGQPAVSLCVYRIKLDCASQQHTTFFLCIQHLIDQRSPSHAELVSRQRRWTVAFRLSHHSPDKSFHDMARHLLLHGEDI